MVTAIALLGDRDTAHVTHRAIDAVADQVRSSQQLRWIPTDSRDAAALDEFGGVWLVPGTPYRDEVFVYDVLRHRRAAGLPTLGTCGGFQYMLVEFARDAAGLTDAAHGEAEPATPTPVVGPLACSLLGEVRRVEAVPGTRLAEVCGVEPFDGFHWCSYGLAKRYASRLEAAGLVFNAHAPDAGVEGFELPGHPFYMGTLFQPQMDALRGEPVHPLIRAFIGAASVFV